MRILFLLRTRSVAGALLWNLKGTRVERGARRSPSRAVGFPRFIERP